MLIAAIDARIPDGIALRDYDRASALALVKLAKGAAGTAARPIVLVDGDVAELVCWVHHALVHEGGWSLRGPAPGTWLRPDGTPFDPRPPDP